MADESTRYKLPYILASQAQKHVTHNEAIRLLDALVGTSVISRSVATPPGSPGDADLYIVASGATGAWAGWDLNIAYYVDGAWMKIVPLEGLRAWVEDEDRLVAYSGSNWILQGGDPARFAAYINFDQTISADTWTKVSFNNAEWNDQGHFNASDNDFTAPVDGLYQFGAAIGWKQDSTNVPTVAKAKFVKNSATTPVDILAPVVSRPLSGVATDGSELVMVIQTMALLDAGDTVEVQQLFTSLSGDVPANTSRFWGNQIG